MAAEREDLAARHFVLRDQHIVLVDDLAAKDATHAVIHVEGDAAGLFIREHLERLRHQVDEVCAARPLRGELCRVDVADTDYALGVVRGKTKIPTEFGDEREEALPV